MLDLSHLNRQQRQAVEQTNGAVMILAGAGTGKTSVISYRIANMIQRGIPAKAIVALTFTNKAAREMKERTKALCPETSKGLIVGTFHSYCLSVLRKYPKDAGLHPKFSLAGTADQIEMVRRGLEEKGWDQLYKPADVLQYISKAKNDLLDPITFLEKGSHGENIDRKTIATVYALYERQLKLNRLIDFDDCIFKLIYLLKKHPYVLDIIHQEKTHFLVDEFQDTNPSQLEALRLQAQKLGNVCVVGDDDQSIYSWRGADPRILQLFEEIFPSTTLITLEQNYRCTDKILHAANTVIKCNSMRKSKTLWSESKSNQPVQVSIHLNENEEARWIAQKCFTLLGQGKKLRDIGILYRANAQARPLEIALRELRLNYKVFGGSSFFEKKEVRDFLAYLKLSFDQTDRLSFWRIINTPGRGIGLKSQETIEQISNDHNCSPLEAAFLAMETALPRIRKGITELKKDLDKVSTMPKNTPEDLNKRGQAIIKLFKLDDEIRKKYKNERAKQSKLDSLKRLPIWLEDMANSSLEDTGSLDPLNILDQLNLGDDKQLQDKNQDNAISLMTIHTAKGLEFPAVFVCGAEEGQLPHRNSVSQQEISEERRLFYVAITRAKKELWISYAKQRFSGYQAQHRQPSRFLQEMPEDGVLYIGKVDQSDPVIRKNQNIKSLDFIKNQIKGGFQRP